MRYTQKTHALRYKCVRERGRPGTEATSIIQSCITHLMLLHVVLQCTPHALNMSHPLSLLSLSPQLSKRVEMLQGDLDSPASRRKKKVHILPSVYMYVLSTHHHGKFLHVHMYMYIEYICALISKYRNVYIRVYICLLVGMCRASPSFFRDQPQTTRDSSQ